ncbi:MAG: tetratricopeptide repeat protein, partial [Candidatus Krumholzibacteriaceae bacterium]
GNVYYLTKKYEESVRELQVYVSLNPRSLKGNLALAQALYANREPRLAVESAEKAASVDTAEAGAVRLLAKIYHDAKNDAKAADAFQRLARRDSLTAEEYMKWGRSLAALKKNPEAIAKLERAAAKDSTLDLQSEIGTLLYLQGRYPEAIAHYDRKIRSSPNAASTYLNRGISYLRLQNFPEAIRSFRKGIELEPGLVQGHLWLAQSYASLDSIDQASAEYKAVARLDSTNAESRRYIGFSHLVKKEYAAAVPSLERAVRLDPGSLQGHLWLAQAYALNREKDKAIIEYNKVLKLDPKNKDAQKGLQLLE